MSTAREPSMSQYISFNVYWMIYDFNSNFSSIGMFYYEMHK